MPLSKALHLHHLHHDFFLFDLGYLYFKVQYSIDARIACQKNIIFCNNHVCNLILNSCPFCPWYKIYLYAIQIFRNHNKKRPFQCNEWQQLAVQTKLKAFLTIFCLCIVSCTMLSTLYCTLNKCPLLFLTEPSLDHYRKFPIWKQHFDPIDHYIFLN